MHEFTFSDAVLSQPVVILRLPLLTYSLGHELLLLRHRNALLIHSAEAFGQLKIAEQIFAVSSAALICSRDWLGNQKRQHFLRFWYWLNRNADWPLQIAEFRNYLTAAHTAMPAPDQRSDEICAEAGGYEPMQKMRGRSFGAPLVARLLNYVTRGELYRAHGFRTPYDFNYALALNLYLTELESEGQARLENHDEQAERLQHIEDVKWAIAAEEKIAAEQAKNPKPEGLATPAPDLTVGGENA